MSQFSSRRTVKQSPALSGARFLLDFPYKLGTVCAVEYFLHACKEQRVALPAFPGTQGHKLPM